MVIKETVFTFMLANKSYKNKWLFLCIYYIYSQKHRYHTELFDKIKKKKKAWVSIVFAMASLALLFSVFIHPRNHAFFTTHPSSSSSEATDSKATSWDVISGQIKESSNFSNELQEISENLLQEPRVCVDLV